MAHVEPAHMNLLYLQNKLIDTISDKILFCFPIFSGLAGLTKVAGDTK